MGLTLTWCEDTTNDSPFWDESAGAEAKNPPPLATAHLPPRVQAVAPLLAITAKEYLRFFDGVRTLDFHGLADAIISRIRKAPPLAKVRAPERFDLRDILARQDDYDTIAHIVEGRLRLLRSMDQRAA